MICAPVQFRTIESPERRHDDGMDVTFVLLADRPELADEVWAMQDSWPEFMTRDPIASMYYTPAIVDLFAEYVLVCQDEAGTVVGKAHSIPFHLADGEQLPADGWDGVIRRGIATHLSGADPNAVSALEIAVSPTVQGRGLSARMLGAMADNARRLGFDQLLAPVRPNGKNNIHEPMTSYANRTREDGLPVDPWLRVHVRAGGEIDGIATRSMVIPGTLDEWRRWTGLPFDRSGPVNVPGALTPVLCDLDNGTAVYVEPNVWVRHHTAATRSVSAR